MSIAQQIRDALAAAIEPLTIGDLLPLCDEAENTTQIASACANLVEAGAIARHKPPEGGRFRYTIVAGAPSEPDDDPDVAPIPTDASEARASRVTPSRKPNGSGPGPGAQTPSRRRSVALPVLGKAPPPRPRPSARVEVEADLQIAITEAGVLALRRGDQVMYLTPEERARMDAFTARFAA